ncbi:LLM class flavin-dependent oxidoreductase [Tenggerimyces flavus]|uniref:LLM class flavin-dependent oxidoreductase n=1 Tax=Tenggerimyces flavus TaxID=1708749 RepID=A0ABV7YSA6_9ACTN|nr:LLM class flavin-dependent oxidoreductase [Tenggerimyces flavus]MBM7784448.1 alkanesulfonate monooxygenase SsuD/methylene tetrahydromethanopterin reductase-like flavin-dependent oxidoreductase (luciferase family) [Tenggerimyces flavus]
MADYGRDLSFGYFLIPNADDPLLDTARSLEALGFEYLGIQDHPYQRRYVDTWTLLSYLAGATSRIRLFPDVSNLALRPPAVLAKAAASLDLLSGGRFDLGLGAGGFNEAVQAYGGPARSPRESYEALEEAIKVIRLIWSGERNLRFAGKHYSLAGAMSGPVPTRPIGIWLGVYGPRAVRLAGRVADGWVPSLQRNAEKLAGLATILDESAVEAGRSPRDIRRVLNVNGQITSGKSDGLLHGPVSQWVDELTDLAVGLGFDTFLLWADGEGQPQRFVDEIIPAVRDQVAKERS